MKTEIAVIGAGLSGLVAARHLRDRGRSVRVFDKGRRPGGRLSGRRAEGFAFDHGAQYFTVRSEAFRARVEDWVRREVVAEWSGRIGVAEGARVRLKTDNPPRFVGMPSMNALARDLAKDLDVVCESRIEGIEPTPAGPRLRAAGGDAHGPFDFVVVTTPPLQAAPLVDGKLRAVAESVVMRPGWAVLAGFDEPVDVEADGLFVNEGPLSWVARNNSKPGRPPGEAWTLHAGPAWSTDHLEDREDEVVEALLSAFFGAVGAPTRRPRYRSAHRWRYALAASPLDEQAVIDPDSRVGLAGDWLAGSRVEGAFVSGLRAAEEIERALDGQ